MRIVDSTNLGNTTPEQTGRAGELHSADPIGKSGYAPRQGYTAPDSVELSGFTDRLSRTMQDAATSRTRRVSEVSAAVRSGSYQVNAEAVSHALVNQAISSGSTGKP